MILWGKQDALFLRADQGTLEARVEGSELEVYPDAAHLPLWVPAPSDRQYDGDGDFSSICDETAH